jgi:hypothetical protein
MHPNFEIQTHWEHGHKQEIEKTFIKSIKQQNSYHEWAKLVTLLQDDVLS